LTAPRRLTLATRGSPLALWQARAYAAALKAVEPSLDARILEIKTSGDLLLDRPIAEVGTQGVFTVEIDRAVQDGRADLAIHSMKDLATTDAEGLVLAGALPRGPVEDALIAPKYGSFDALPKDAVLATGSARRRAMLLRSRPDLRFIDARGNVATRLSKLDSGEADGMILALAGLERLGLSARVDEVLPVSRALPAVGQALVAATCRADDVEVREWTKRASDARALACGVAERAFLRTLRGGCRAPIGGLATLQGENLRLVGVVLSVDGRHEVGAAVEGAIEDAAALGESLARRLLRRGAASLLRS
jgi:hydroxymethylbilane synthase